MTPRSLVGMTMGARKRAALHESLHTQDTSPKRLTKREARMVWASVCNMVAHSRPWREQVRKSYRIGQRLRPCLGCQECGVRRFTKPEGFFTDNTHYIEIRNNAKVRLWRLRHTPILWRSKCGPRSVPTTFYDLEYCVGMVERFEWIELTQPNLCDGSGVLPAKGKARRCSLK